MMPARAMEKKMMRTTLPFAAALALLLPAAGWAQEPGGPQPAPDKPVGADITVQQPTPDVTVRQQKPDVTIQQARPDVNLDVARPVVNVDTPPPQVQIQPTEGQVQAQINRAQPQVDIRQAKPVVNIQQAEPEVIVERAEGPPQISIQKLTREQAELADMGIQRREDLVGMTVVDREDQEIGSVSDLMTQNGRIQSAVVRQEGGLLSGDKMVAVPWSAFQVDQENKRLRVQMSEDELREMPEFNYDEQTQQQALVGPEGQQQQQPQQQQQNPEQQSQR